MKVHAHAIQSKRPDQTADDVTVIAEHCVAVIDGATDKAGYLYQWHDTTVSSGRFAALVVADALAHSDPHAAPALLVEQATTALRVAVTAQYPDLPTYQWPACVVVAYQPATNTLWRVGDCQWTYQGDTHTFLKDIDAVTTRMRAAVTEALLATGASTEILAATDPGRAAILGLLSTQNAFANQHGPFGYGCINGTPVPNTYLETHVLEPGERLILTSDGYPEVLDTYEATEARLADLLAADPLCIRELQSTKALAPGAIGYDDRTWLEITT